MAKSLTITIDKVKWTLDMTIEALIALGHDTWSHPQINFKFTAQDSYGPREHTVVVKFQRTKQAQWDDDASYRLKTSDGPWSRCYAAQIEPSHRIGDAFSLGRAFGPFNLPEEDKLGYALLRKLSKLIDTYNIRRYASCEFDQVREAISNSGLKCHFWTRYYSDGNEVDRWQYREEEKAA